MSFAGACEVQLRTLRHGLDQYFHLGSPSQMTQVGNCSPVSRKYLCSEFIIPCKGLLSLINSHVLNHEHRVAGYVRAKPSLSSHAKMSAICLAPFFFPLCLSALKPHTGSVSSLFLMGTFQPCPAPCGSRPPGWPRRNRCPWTSGRRSVSR